VTAERLCKGARPLYWPEDLVFTAPLGGALRENNFMARRFRPATRRCACLHDPGDPVQASAAVGPLRH